MLHMLLLHLLLVDSWGDHATDVVASLAVS